MHLRPWLVALLVSCSACCASESPRPLGAPPRRDAPAASATAPVASVVPSAPTSAVAPAPPIFGFSTPESQGIDSGKLIELTEWVRSTPTPIFSLLISRNNRVVYELYTSSIRRDDAHYLMSVTKSVVSALVGIAIDQHLLTGPDQSIADALPAGLFKSAADRERLRPVTIHHLLGMSALDALVPPHSDSADARQRQAQFWKEPNRVKFALDQKLLPSPGVSFQYSDIGPMIAVGMVQYASGKSALRFAEDNLFGPMQFSNYEWMHQDPTGIDNGGYGLRLRPIDMQKFGMLYLQHGSWEGRQLISRGWVDRSFTPWIRNKEKLKHPNYGWYWWARTFKPSWTAHIANGWKGQRIAVFPEQGIVVTMTALMEDGGDEELFADIVSRFVVPATRPAALAEQPAVSSALAALLETVRLAPTRVAAAAEKRMIPSPQPKETHRDFHP